VSNFLGVPINPTIDIGQIEGAFVQGMGLFTMEELVWGDSEHPWVRPGQLQTRGPGTYKLPTANDVPLQMHIELWKGNVNNVCVCLCMSKLINSDSQLCVFEKG